MVAVDVPPGAAGKVGARSHALAATALEQPEHHSAPHGAR